MRGGYAVVVRGGSAVWCGAGARWWHVVVVRPPEAGAAAARVGRMTKWEYATVPLLVHATKQILDTWGEDGWELVQVVPGPNNPEQLVAYLKREKQA